MILFKNLIWRRWYSEMHLPPFLKIANSLSRQTKPQEGTGIINYFALMTSEEWNRQ